MLAAVYRGKKTLQSMQHIIIPRTCVKGLSNRFVRLSVSVCQSGCCMRLWHGNLKKKKRWVPDRDQSSSLLCISSSFLFNIGILIPSTTWIRWRPGICGLQACVCIHQLPCSQDCKTLAGAWERDNSLGVAMSSVQSSSFQGDHVDNLCVVLACKMPAT